MDIKEQMKPIERVVAALNHKEADRVPVYPLLNGVSRSLVGADYKKWATDADTCAKAYIAATDLVKPDCICTLTDLSVETADFGQKMNYPANEAAHPDINDRLIKNIEDFSKLKKIDPRTTPRMSTHIQLCDKLVKARGKDYPIAAFVFGPLGIASMLRDQAQLYMDIYDKPEILKAAVETINETLIDYCDALIETGVHAIMIDTLFASKSIMSKDMWVEFEGIFVKKLAQHIHSKGCMVMIHNCGCGVYFDVQIEAMNPEAISFLHVPDDCNSFADAKAKYGNKTTLIGAIDPTWLPQATGQEVDQKCKEQIDIFKKDGGFVLATGCEYPANLSLDHAKTMVKTAQTYGKY